VRQIALILLIGLEVFGQISPRDLYNKKEEIMKDLERYSRMYNNTFYDFNPNPFNYRLSINSIGMEDCIETVRKYDIHGNHISTHVHKYNQGNWHITMSFPLTPSGIYIFEYQAGGNRLYKKVLIMQADEQKAREELAKFREEHKGSFEDSESEMGIDRILFGSFWHTGMIRFHTPRNDSVTLGIHNFPSNTIISLIKGDDLPRSNTSAAVKMLTNKSIETDPIINWEIEFDVEDLPDGVYYCSLTVRGKTVYKKFVWLKEFHHFRDRRWF